MIRITILNGITLFKILTLYKNIILNTIMKLLVWSWINGFNITILLSLLVCKTNHQTLRGLLGMNSPDRL